MKKNFLFTTLIVATLLASCNKDEDMYGETGNRVPVTFSAIIDTGSLARANSSADDPVSRCLMEEVETVEGEPKTSYGVQSMTDMGNGQYALSGVMLNPNKEYTFLFWADGGDNHYTADDLTAIGIAADAREAGIAYRAKKEWSGDKSISVTLTHAVTKVSLTSTTSVPSAQTVTLSGLTEYKGYNVMSDSPAGETTGFTHSATGKGQAGDVFSFYAIVTDETQDLTLNAGGHDVAVNSVPLGQNKHIILRGDVANAGFTEVAFTASIDNSWGNTGTEYIDDYIIDSTGTYIVYTAKGLLAWAAYVNEGHWDTNCTLAADITIPTTGDKQSNWTPVGVFNNYQDNKPYAGTFDGKNFTVSGLTVNDKNKISIGLFAFVGSEGTVKNLFLMDVYMNGQDGIGGVAGFNIGTIENCSVAGTICGETEIGGITGVNNGSVNTCDFSGDISGESGPMLGGVVGYNNRGNITACHSSGTVSGADYVGGAIGINDGGNITACYFTGNVSGHKRVGGVIGGNDNGPVVSCYFTGSISGDEKVGGVMGINSRSTVSACYWSNYEGLGIGQGEGDAIEVDGSDVTWADAQTEMNATLSGYDWQYVGATENTPPTLSVSSLPSL